MREYTFVGVYLGWLFGRPLCLEPVGFLLQAQGRSVHSANDDKWYSPFTPVAA